MWDLHSLTRDWTHIPCIGRWNLNPWTTWDILQPHLTDQTQSLSYLLKDRLHLNPMFHFFSGFHTSSPCGYTHSCLLKKLCKENRYLHLSMHAKPLQSCPTLCDLMDYGPPGSSVRGISQARILEWVAISFSRGSSRPKDRTHVSYVSCVDKQIFFFLPLVPPGKPIYTQFSLNIQPSPRTWLTPKRLILFGDHVCLRRKMSPVPLHRGYLFWLEELRQTC